MQKRVNGAFHSTHFFVMLSEGVHLWPQKGWLETLVPFAWGQGVRLFEKNRKLCYDDPSIGFEWSCWQQKLDSRTLFER